MQRRAFVKMAAGVPLGALLLQGCSMAGDSTSEATNADISAKADAAIKELESKVSAKGPHNETASPASTVDLTDDEVSKVKAMGASAAIAMHTSGDDWSAAQIAGLKSEFDRLGIKVLSTTDANMDPRKQVSDIETIMAKSPTILVSIPTDPVATASAYKAAAAKGTTLVFMDNVPNGMSAGKEYVTVVSSDNYGNGQISAHLLAKALGGKGKVAAIYYEADYFVTNQRYSGFKAALKTSYPDITLVAERGINGSDLAGAAQRQADALLNQHSDLKGIWAVWDVPAEGVIASARTASRSGLSIATEDLGKNVAIAMAQGQYVCGLGAQRPYAAGITEARAAAKALLKQDVPPFIALSPLAVTKANLAEAWQTVYHSAAPSQVQKALQG